jgi:hypothetical protein
MRKIPEYLLIGSLLLLISYLLVNKEEKLKGREIQQLFDASNKIEKRTIWFGSMDKFSEFAITSPKNAGWEERNLLYIERRPFLKIQWEKINIPEDECKVVDLCGIHMDNENVFIMTENPNGKRTSYNYNLETKTFVIVAKE